MQHVAGFIMFEDIRETARRGLNTDLDPATRAVAEEAIDSAIYGLMQVIDGVSGTLRSDEHKAYLRMAIKLEDRAGDVVDELDLFHGDGVCMGVHSWMDGDFGDATVARPRA